MTFLTQFAIFRSNCWPPQSELCLFQCQSEGSWAAGQVVTLTPAPWPSTALHLASYASRRFRIEQPLTPLPCPHAAPALLCWCLKGCKRTLEWRARLGEDVVAVSPSFHKHTSLSITRSLTCSVSHLLSVSQNSSSWSPYFVQSIGSLSSYFPYLPRLSCVAGHEQSDHTNPQLVGVLFCGTIWRLPSLTVDLLCCHQKKSETICVIALIFLCPIHKLYPQCPLSWPPFLSLKGFTLQV